MNASTTTGGGPYFTCHKCGAQYPQGNAHHCSTTSILRPTVSSAENGRLIWLDDELFDWIAQYAGSQRPVPTGLLILIGKREAAPADPAEVADKAGEEAAIRYWEGMRGELEDTERMDAEDVGQDVARAVLAALVPDASQRRSGGDSSA